MLIVTTIVNDLTGDLNDFGSQYFRRAFADRDPAGGTPPPTSSLPWSPSDVEHSIPVARIHCSGGEQLQALSRLLDDNESEIVEALALDLGRPAADAWLADIGAIQLELKYVLRRLKSWMRDTRAVLPLVQQPGSGRVHREPLGVVLVIGPWNYPFYLTLGPLVGVLAAGNCG